MLGTPYPIEHSRSLSNPYVNTECFSDENSDDLNYLNLNALPYHSANVSIHTDSDIPTVVRHFHRNHNEVSSDVVCLRNLY